MKAKQNLGKKIRSAVPKKPPVEPEILIQRLQKLYPDSKCSLDYETPFQLLVATILSAQCTDVRVNKVTPALFDRFPDPEKMAKASQEDLELLVASTGFFRNKAKNIKAAAQILTQDYQGDLPREMDQLGKLPGVGRKTANVVLGNAFGIISGVVVDTHVKRLSFRLGLTKQINPEKIEEDLSEKIPRKYWIQFSHWLIDHGRRICLAQRPKCEVCPLLDICPQRGVPKLVLTA